MKKEQEREPVSHLPLSIRLSRPAFELMLMHKENIGLLKGTIFGALLAASIVVLRESPLALAGITVLLLVSLYQIYRVAKRADYYNTFKKEVVAVADEYELYLRYSNLGTIIKTVQAEVSGEIFQKGQKLSDAEVAAVIEAAMKNNRDRPVALIKLNEAARLIDEALEQWVGKYPNHSLERTIETLEAIRTAEERRTMRIVLDDPERKEKS